MSSLSSCFTDFFKKKKSTYFLLLERLQERERRERKVFHLDLLSKGLLWSGLAEARSWQLPWGLPCGWRKSMDQSLHLLLWKRQQREAVSAGSEKQRLGKRHRCSRQQLSLMCCSPHSCSVKVCQSTWAPASSAPLPCPSACFKLLLEPDADCPHLSPLAEQPSSLRLQSGPQDLFLKRFFFNLPKGTCHSFLFLSTTPLLALQSSAGPSLGLFVFFCP